jgi:hypothetical protein
MSSTSPETPVDNDLNKLLVAKVVIILEKAKRKWPLRQEAKVIFEWRLDAVRHIKSIMGKEVIGIEPIFTCTSIRLAGADQNEPRDALIYHLLPCDWWPSGKTILTISDDGIVIDHPHPLLK